MALGGSLGSFAAEAWCRRVTSYPSSTDRSNNELWMAGATRRNGGSPHLSLLGLHCDPVYFRELPPKLVN